MSNQQKYSILANDLVRRLSDINNNIVTKEEIPRVIEQFIQMTVTFLYHRKHSIEKEEMRAMHKNKRDKKRPEEPGHEEHEESPDKNMKENPNHKNKAKGCTLCNLHLQY